MEKIIEKIEQLQVLLNRLLDDVKKFQESLESEEQTYPEDSDDHERDAYALGDNL